MTQSISELDMGLVIREYVPPPSELFCGVNADVDASAEQLTTVSTPLQVGVTLRADLANTDIVYIISSAAGTISTGYPLEAGDERFIPIDDLNKVWLIGGAANQSVRYIGN